jgi:replication factor A1
VDEIIQKILEKSELGEDEIRGKIESKRKELNGLITLEGAAHIIAGELGINLLEGRVDVPRLKLENVIPGMSSVDVVGRIIQLFEIRTFEKEEDKKGKVASGILGDGTSALRIVFWDENADLLESKSIKEGDIIRLRDGYTKENRSGEAEIHVGNRALIEVNPTDIDPDEIPRVKDSSKKLSELASGMMSVEVVVKVLRIYEAREFPREDGSKGKVANLFVADESSSTRLVFWDEHISILEEGEIKEGDILRIKRAYVRENQGQIEVHLGRYGKVEINPEDANPDEFQVKALSKALRTKIKDISPNSKAEVRGVIVRIYDNPTIFERDGEQRLVVNGVIDDGTGRIHGVFFNKMGEKLLDTNIESVADGDPQDLVKKRENILAGKEILISGNVQENDRTGRLEIIVFGLDLDPDPKVEIENLLIEASALLGDKHES